VPRIEAHDPVQLAGVCRCEVERRSRDVPHSWRLRHLESGIGVDVGQDSFRQGEVLGEQAAGAIGVAGKNCVQGPAVLARQIALRSRQRDVQAYFAGLRWVLAPANADAAAARHGLAIFADPVTGAAPDGRFDMEGFRAVPRLRTETLGAWGRTPPPPARFLELGVWDRAMAGL
jgi:hypothetical protein